MIARITLYAALSASTSATAAGQTPVELLGPCARVTVIVDKDASVHWGGVLLSSRDALEEKLIEAGREISRPCLDLVLPRDDLSQVGPVIALMQKHQLRVAFVTQPAGQ